MSGTVTGTLKHGLAIGDERHTEFELREATTGDLFEAEALARADCPLKFNGAMMTLQLVRIGSFEGAITLAMISRLKPVDYAILRGAQLELEALGEAE